jgi:hypothetical protein
VGVPALLRELLRTLAQPQSVHTRPRSTAPKPNVWGDGVSAQSAFVGITGVHDRENGMGERRHQRR